MNAWGWVAAGVVGLAALVAGRRMSWPVPFLAITDPFGTPRSYGPHNGVDLRAPIGTEVTAPDSGRIVERTFTNRGGLSLVMQLDNGLRAGFAHLSETVQPVGAVVQRGELIAYTGESGAAGQPHLHFTLFDGERYLDPAKLCA